MNRESEVSVDEEVAAICVFVKKKYTVNKIEQRNAQRQ